MKQLNPEDVILVQGKYWAKEDPIDSPSIRSPAGFLYFYHGVDKDSEGVYTLNRTHYACFEPLEKYNES